MSLEITVTQDLETCYALRHEVFVVEQNVRMALILAKYGYIIRDGVIMMEGEADHLISDPAVKDSFLGGSVADTSKSLRN